VGYLDAGEAAAEFSKAMTEFSIHCMANDLLYKASLHLGASPQNKRSSLLYKIPTAGNRQQCTVLAHLISWTGMNQLQTVDKLTGSHIEKFLNKRCDVDHRDLPQRVKAAVAASHIRADFADRERTVFSYLGAMYRNLDKQGALSVLEDASGVKRVVRRLIEKLSPPCSRILSRTHLNCG
jgi:hypothetical protein